MRSVMRACIGSNRAPDGRYAEIDLPASPYRLLNALDEIGIKSTKEIVYQEILNYGSFGYLEPHFDEYTMLEELNTLAQKLAVFDRVDSIAFEGLVKMAEQKPEPFGVKELINFAHSTESCHVVSDVFDDEQLGRFYAGNGFMPEYETLPDKIYEHLDFAKIGREARESEGGVFTQRGYHPLSEMERVPAEELPKRLDELFDRMDKENVGFVVTEEGKDSCVFCPYKWFELEYETIEVAVDEVLLAQIKEIITPLGWTVERLIVRFLEWLVDPETQEEAIAWLMKAKEELGEK